LHIMSPDISSKGRDQDNEASILQERRLVWPPKLRLQTPMGYLRDCTFIALFNGLREL
jgi:hypothetical protein